VEKAVLLPGRAFRLPSTMTIIKHKNKQKENTISGSYKRVTGKEKCTHSGQ
jgi:hypothetical protein